MNNRHIDVSAQNIDSNIKMISQRCPVCKSKRIRRGYRVTPFWQKIVFVYNLLCDNCNWEFRGFAVPGTVNGHRSSRKNK